MTNSSILGGTAAPRQADGKDVDLLGPSDSSDSGSDVQGERAMPTTPDNPGEWGAVVSDRRSDTDAGGTGERASADGGLTTDGSDILPDRVVSVAGEEDELLDDAQTLASDEDSDDDAVLVRDASTSRGDRDV